MQSFLGKLFNGYADNQGIIKRARKLYVEHEAELGILFVFIYANIYYVKFS